MLSLDFWVALLVPYMMVALLMLWVEAVIDYWGYQPVGRSWSNMILGSIFWPYIIYKEIKKEGYI